MSMALLGATKLQDFAKLGSFFLAGTAEKINVLDISFRR
jgi:hypothetical protein